MKNKRLFLLSAFLVIIGTLKAQNPIITDQFTADPTAKVFEGKMYVYPSHDIPSPIERLKEWFCMADYHVFSSDNLVDWTDHGDRKSTRLNSSHIPLSRMPSSA